MPTSLLENVYNRLLSESTGPDVSHLAAYVIDDPQSKKAVLYDPSDIQVDGGFVSIRTVPASVRGYIAIVPCKQECNGAWQIAAVAGPGKIIYGIGYALSPLGMLVPDRSGAISRKAQHAWAGASKKRPSLPLDDFNLHDPYTDLPTKDHPHHTTGIFSDDCKLVHIPGHPELDRSYPQEGWELPMLQQLQANHRSFLNRIPPADTKDLLTKLKTAGNNFFAISAF